MLKIQDRLTSYNDSKMIFEFDVKPKLFIGDFFYDESFKRFFIAAEIKEESISGLELETMSMVNIPYDAVFKAFSVSELSDLIPNSITLPQRFPEGWSHVTGDGEIIKYSDVTFFESDIEAYTKYFIFLLRIKEVKPELINFN